MSKTQSQWNFGELFPAESLRKVMSVSELTGQIRNLLEKSVGQVWVNGEVTNLRVQRSGHSYFTLKDATSQLSCVLFSREKVSHRGLLADGQRLLLQGDVTVYEARGQYQLIVRSVELQGVGALQIAFEKLKQKLAAEGLFAPERKRPLPKYPQRIGLVTSPAGAAIRDVLHVIQRRHPGLEIILAPCRVQGRGAAAEIAEAIRLLNEFDLRSSRGNEAQTSKSEIGNRKSEISQSLLTSAATEKLALILITRGGGSLEDLWAFNEEVVARAIFESAVPVVSAVGHEIDFTIADFVADVRAATPSAGAEVITEGFFAGRQLVGGLIQRLLRVHPRRLLNELVQRLDDSQTSLLRRVKQGVNEQAVKWKNLASRLRQVRPKQFLQQRREAFTAIQKRLRELVEAQLQNRQSLLAATEARLRLLGPEQVLSRGYSITMDVATGKIIRAERETQSGQLLRTRVKEGEISSRVMK